MKFEKCFDCDGFHIIGDKKGCMIGHDGPETGKFCICGKGEVNWSVASREEFEKAYRYRSPKEVPK